MLSRENKVMVAFIALALLSLFVLLSLSEPPTWVSGALVIGIGVIAPLLVNTYLDRRDDEQ